MNPCPCGDGGSPGGCRCSEHALARYVRRLSGPLVDRFDLRVPVTRPDPRHVVGGAPGESSAVGRRAGARGPGPGRRAGRALQRPARARPTSSGTRRWRPTRPSGSRRCCATTASAPAGLQRVRRVALTLADLADESPPLRTGPPRHRRLACAPSRWPTALRLAGLTVTSARRRCCPPEAWVTALSSLDGMGPAGLRALLDDHADRRGGLAGRARGRVHAAAVRGAMGRRAAPSGSSRRWAASRGRFDVAGVLAAPRRRRHRRGAPGHRVLSRPPSSTIREPPPILFHQGDPDVVVGTRVAIVGTRDCTRYGYDLAFELGARPVGGRHLGRVGPGARHRQRRPRRRARRRPGPADRRGRQRARRRLPPPQRAAVARVAARGVVWSEYPLGSSAAAVALPGPQPADRGAGRRRGGRRVARQGRGAAHRRRGRATRSAGDGGARAGAQPVVGGQQRPAGRRARRRRWPATPPTCSSPSASQSRLAAAVDRAPARAHRRRPGRARGHRLAAGHPRPPPAAHRALDPRAGVGARPPRATPDGSRPAAVGTSGWPSPVG